MFQNETSLILGNWPNDFKWRYLSKNQNDDDDDYSCSGFKVTITTVEPE